MSVRVADVIEAMDAGIPAGTGGELGKGGIAAVVSSPLGRALDTARASARALGIEVDSSSCASGSKLCVTTSWSGTRPRTCWW